MNTLRHFAVCIQNDGYEGTLELRKIYQVLEDPMAETNSFVRVIDESGEDYLYPKDWFLSLVLPQRIEEVLAQLSSVT